MKTRLQLAFIAALLWGFYAMLDRAGFAFWITDLIFFIAALCLWLGRTRAVFLLASLGTFATLGLRNLGGVYAIVPLQVLLLAAAPRVDEFLKPRSEAKTPAKSAPFSPRRAAAAAAVFAVLVFEAGRPALLMVAPWRRRAILDTMSPAFPVQDPKTLSPLAARLRGHVTALSKDIGERSMYEPAAQEKAKDYVAARFREAGYAPEILDYRLGDGAVRRNVEAALPGASEDVWVLGAHYDGAPGTPGADDNASGVAVLLEAARLLKARAPRRPIRFVAFGTEEPPSFATRDMGSWHYAHDLKARGVKVHGLLNLEMLGYFNPRPGSQLFPPFLNLLYPDRGEFIGLVSNLASAGLLRSVAAEWRKNSLLPAEETVLPSAFSVMALSDQLNFWGEGYRAVMISDTAFFRNPNYHQSSDTAEKLDYEKMAAETTALVEILSR